MALHGTPGSGLKFAGNHACTERNNLRLICPDRWGYGRSDPPRTPNLAAYAADMASLADALGLDRFGVLGVSGGGPFAVAVAAGLGPRVNRAALVCPVGQVAEIDAAKLAPFHRMSFLLLPRIPGAMRLTFTAYCAVIRRLPDLAVRIAAARACADDRRLMREPELRRALSDAFRDGMSLGVDGCVIDMALFARAWRLDTGIRCPARVWIGEHDGNVPITAAVELARTLGAELTVLPSRGHFWISGMDHDVWSWLDAA